MNGFGGTASGRYRLELEHFRTLIRGGEVEFPDGAKIILADIGWQVMSIELTKAVMESDDVPNVRPHDAGDQ